MTEIWTVPGFTHVRELGAGGSGRVFQAVDDLTQTPVAVKYVEQRIRLGGRFQNGLGPTARRLARIEDPNLVQVYDYVLSPESAALIVELVEGSSLARVLDVRGPIGPLPALAAFSGALMGLAALHAAGLAHGRFTPAGLLIDRDGTPKVSDSGLEAADGTDPRSAPYVAPEQWDGAPPGPATDLYAATAVFFECLTGRPPFTAKNVSGLGKAHRAEPVPLDAVPEPLRELVSAGLAKAPEDRPASAADLLAGLDEVVTQVYGSTWEAQGRGELAELGAKAAAAPVRTARVARPARLRVLIGATLTLVVLVAAIVYGVTQGHGSTAAPAQKATPVPETHVPKAATAPSATPATPAELALAIRQAAAKSPGAAFTHRRDACCGDATAARGVFSSTPARPVSYDMTVWSPAPGDRSGRRTRTIVVGDTAYIAAGSGWRPVPAVRKGKRADVTGTYAALAAQTRWGSSVPNILALLRSSRTVTRSGLTYSGIASLQLLARDGSVGPLYAGFAGSGGARVAFTVRVGQDYLPRTLQVTVTPRTGGDARAQVFRTTYSGWGRPVAIDVPGAGDPSGRPEPA
ncbi:MAG: serine/threonine protein kinase [Streptosporangiaceae bacterium]|nr:serine/threonine protein kinase [Streptosporangiaceae bacterium]